MLGLPDRSTTAATAAANASIDHAGVLSGWYGYNVSWNYAPLVADIVGLIHVQGGTLNSIGNNQLRMLDQFQMGSNLVRGFAPNGIGPRDLTFYPYTGTGDAIGGSDDLDPPKCSCRRPQAIGVWICVARAFSG